MNEPRERRPLPKASPARGYSLLELVLSIGRLFYALTLALHGLTTSDTVIKGMYTDFLPI